MTSDIQSTVAAIKGRFNGCFGCGDENPIGLHLHDFVVVDKTVTCTWTPESGFQSFPDVVHGGVVTAALDEIMAWTAMLLVGFTVVTGTMELKFKKPAPIGERLTVEATLIDHRGRRVMLSSAIRGADGSTIATASAMFITLEPVADAVTP